jgi:hypothetical protein
MSDTGCAFRGRHGGDARGWSGTFAIERGRKNENSIHPSILVVCALAASACLPDLKEDTGYQEFKLAQDESDLCLYSADGNDDSMKRFGTSKVAELTTPDNPQVPSPGQTFEVEHIDLSTSSSTEACYENNETTDDFDDLYTRANWNGDFDGGSCDDACDSSTENIHSAIMTVRVYDGDNSTLLQPDDYDALPPGLPIGTTYTWARYSGSKFTGRFWYAILTRIEDRVCVVAKWAETQGSKKYYAVILADEEIDGDTRTYTWVDDAGLYFIDDGLEATEVEDGDDRTVSGTTGDSTKNSFYGLSGSFSFEPAEGPGATWGNPTLRMANHYCSALRQAN